MENTEKQEDVIQEVETQDQPVEEQKPVEEKISYKEVKDDGTIKIDLSKLKKFQEQDESTQEQSTDEVPVRDEQNASEEVPEENKEEQVEELAQQSEAQEEVVLEEVTQEEVAEAKKVEAETIVEQPVVEKEVEPQVVIPENLQDLVKFMEETGGSLEDYARLNADYSNIDNDTLLLEYYKNTKPHLNMEEINFLIEDNFQFDEDVDEPRDIRKKKLAFKEEIAKAKKHLTGLKDQYYKEVKLGSKLTREQQEAVSFYNKYSQEQEALNKAQKASAEHFKNVTDNVFNQNFKGFDFNVGEKTYRFKVNDVQNTRQYQSDILNFVSEYVDENNMMNDAKGYHKALYAAKNIDKIVKHFYDQGRADAIKETTMKAKNIDMSPRSAPPVVDASGFKVKVLNGEDTSRLKFKIRK
jgi:hypothetical protein|tara:strand:+ start:87 stop:1319 length:1233 start_codon:yes stop_codon:yes gene_type:complete